MAVAVARNIQKTVTFDRDRLSAIEAMAASMGASFSAAVARLVDLHAGAALEHMEKLEAPDFESSRYGPKKLTGELVSAICGAVREGATIGDAYRRAEVRPKVGQRWERTGAEHIEQEKRSLYADLVVSLDRARAEFNIELLRQLIAKGDPKAVLKMLDGEQFAEVKHSTVDVAVRFTPLVEWERMPLEVARQFTAWLEEYSPSADDPAVTRTARPAIEAVPVDVLEAIDDGDWTEAPSLEGPKARPLGGQKPDH